MEQKKINVLDQWCLRKICGIKWSDFVMNEEVQWRTNQLPLTLIMRMRCLGLFGHVARSDPANDTRRALTVPTSSQWKGRPQNSWLSVVSKDKKGVGIPDAMVMAEDRMRWKRVVAAHATPMKACFLTDRLTRSPKHYRLNVIRKTLNIYDRTSLTLPCPPWGRLGSRRPCTGTLK